MPKQEQYTLEEAKKRAEELGSPWTPTLEAQLRKAGKIVDPVAKPVGLPWWQELGAGLGSMIAGPTSGGGEQLDAASRLATGTTMGEQMTAGAAGGLTAGQVSPDMLGIPDPASIVQRGSSLFGQGAGMTAAFTPIGKGAGAVAGGIANPLLRAAATGALSFGAYNAAAPAENLGERAKNALEGGVTGGILGPLPMLPGVRRLAALPGGRTATDLAAFTGLGVAHGQDPLTALAEGAVQLPAMRLVHGAAENVRGGGRPTPEQALAEIEALDARLANERAPMQADVSARVAPFREAQANAQRLSAEPAPELVRPTTDLTPEQAAMSQRTIDRVEAMKRLRDSRTAEPAPMPEQPLARTPAQMEIPLDMAPVSEQPKPAKETRGQRRARLQAEASAVNAEAARRVGIDLGVEPAPALAEAPRRITKKEIREQRTRAQVEQGSRDLAEAMGRRPRREVTTDMMGGQQIFEAVGKALAKPVRETVAEIKDTPRRMRNLKDAAKTDWDAAREQLQLDVNENPASVPFSRANRGEQTYEQAVDQVAAMPRRVRKVTDLRSYPDKATEGVKDIIDTDNLSALRADISKPLADRLDRAPVDDLPDKQRGFTDPVRKTQEISDGELASAIEMSEIHGGREIEMATYKHGAEVGGRYRDLKAKTGIKSPEQLDIAGKLLRKYVSENRGHIGDDLAFVRDPEVRQLLLDSGNPSGMFDYVKGLRGEMDALANLYNKANKALGGEGIGDQAAYFPSVPVKPKFFEIGERLARAKARKGADPRVRNTADEVFNPRSQRKSSPDGDTVTLDGREVPRELNAEKVFEGYMDTMLRGISGDIALSQSLKAAKYDDILADRAERAGNQQEADNRRRRADVIRTLAQQKWNHQLFGVGARAEDVFKAFGAPGSMALEAVAANKRAFDNTKYRLNPRFNLVTQWTSILNPSMADPVAAMLALRDMGVPRLPNGAKKFAESTYEFKRKAMPHSQMRAQAEGTGSIAETLNAPISKGRKAAAFADKVFVDGLTQGIENWANKYSALIGYHSTRNLKGLTPRQRALAAGQTVFKTQSAFTFGERAGVLNSRAVQGLYPAQGYAVELANQIREALGATGVDTKLYGESGTQQIRRAGAIVAAAVMQNIWQNVMFNWMRGKSPEESLTIDSIWDATLALPPFIGLVLPSGKGGRDMPNPALPIAQANMVASKTKRLVKKAVEGEPVDEAATDLARYGVGNWGGRGGALASDLLGKRYNFMFGDDDTGAAAPNTVRALPVAPKKATGKKAIARR